jgi:hypothetical protein
LLIGAVSLAAAALPAQVRITRGLGGGNAATHLLEDSPSDFGVGGWRVGQWARYSITQNVGAPMPVGQLRTVSVVGRQGDQYWIETQDEFVGAIQRAALTRKALFPFGPLRARVGGESYVLGPDSSVQRITLVRAGSAQPQRTPFPQGWSRAGEESVTTAAGSFRAVRWRKGTEELWTSGEAGPIGVVRYRSSEFETELAARGETGARSRIPFGGGSN